MTQAELDALPDVGLIASMLQQIDGKTMIVPVLSGKAMFMGDDSCTVVDAFGDRWMIGEVDGVRSKQRVPNR